MSTPHQLSVIHGQDQKILQHAWGQYRNKMMQIIFLMVSVCLWLTCLLAGSVFLYCTCVKVGEIGVDNIRRDLIFGEF